MTEYCTLAQAKSELKATTTINDDTLWRLIRQVSKRIDLTIGKPKRPFFAPYTEQRSFPANMMRINTWANQLSLYDNLLSFSEILIGASDETASVELWPPVQSPYDQLRLTDAAKSWYVDCNASSDDILRPVYIYVTGVWGWHSDYPNAYVQRDALAAAIVNATDTTLTVADADGTDEDGLTPRFSRGNLIRIDDELMDVVAVNTTTNVLTVKRGVNGTTAAAHLIAAAVEVFLVDERIVRIASRQSALLYARQGAFQVETLDGVGVVTYPQDLLSELRGVLEEFQYA